MVQMKVVLAAAIHQIASVAGVNFQLLRVKTSAHNVSCGIHSLLDPIEPGISVLRYRGARTAYKQLLTDHQMSIPTQSKLGVLARLCDEDGDAETKRNLMQLDLEECVQNIYGLLG